ncbi:MAG: hypothetical protein HQL26_06185 [Candidatus Omnitrophica bacterium]|nr:hypothetical protein [Candidatus Omnitrophota bacterium]
MLSKIALKMVSALGALRRDQTLFLKILFFVLLFSLLAVFYCPRIQLHTADLGRHIKNGEIFLAQHKIISTNFYSYTEPDFSAVNHHWAAGVAFFLVWKYFGFTGLSLFYMGILLAAFSIIFFCAVRLSNFWIAFFYSVLCLPLLVSRLEIRPEGFSYLFLALMIWCLLCLNRYLCQDRFLNSTANSRSTSFFQTFLFISIILIQILWVNFHIYFIFGPFLVGMWCLNRCLNSTVILSNVYGLWFLFFGKNKLYQQPATNNQQPPTNNFILRDQTLGILFIAVILACFINPAGIKGALEPFNIFKEYGYMLAENQSPIFMFKRFPQEGSYLYFMIIFGVSVLVWGAYTWCLISAENLFAVDSFWFLVFGKNKLFQQPATSNQQPTTNKYILRDLTPFILDKTPDILFFIIYFLFSILVWKMIRGMVLWALISIPILSYITWCLISAAHRLLPCTRQEVFVPDQQVSGRDLTPFFQFILIILGMIGLLFGLIGKNNIYSPYQKNYLSAIVPQTQHSFWWFPNVLREFNKLPGTMPGAESAANFFKQNHLQGPIFNNYDIGGYLILSLFPEKVFVDNRPEAYSVDFFKNTYVPMQENDNEWFAQDQKYHFNVIFFYRHDLTPWGQSFLIRRIRDPQWAPVFVDAYTLILVKREGKNKGVIEKYELPQEIFQVY